MRGSEGLRLTITFHWTLPALGYFSTRLVAGRTDVRRMEHSPTSDRVGRTFSAPPIWKGAATIFLQASELKIRQRLLGAVERDGGTLG